MPFARITVRADQMNGEPCIRVLRIPVATVVGMLADGMSAAQVMAAFLAFEDDDTSAAIAASETRRIRIRPLPVA